jgi:hypothetical protein
MPRVPPLVIRKTRAFFMINKEFPSLPLWLLAKVVPQKSCIPYIWVHACTMHPVELSKVLQFSKLSLYQHHDLRSRVMKMHAAFLFGNSLHCCCCTAVQHHSLQDQGLHLAWA